LKRWAVGKHIIYESRACLWRSRWSS